MIQTKIMVLTFFPHDIQKAQRRIEAAMSSGKMPLETVQTLNSVIEILQKGRIVVKEPHQTTRSVTSQPIGGVKC